MNQVSIFFLWLAIILGAIVMAGIYVPSEPVLAWLNNPIGNITVRDIILLILFATAIRR